MHHVRARIRGADEGVASEMGLSEFFFYKQDEGWPPLLLIGQWEISVWLLPNHFSTTRDANGTTLSGNHLDRRRNQPLRSDLGSSQNPAVQGQSAHPVLQDA